MPEQDAKVVSVHKKSKKKHHQKHKDDGAPKSGAEKDMYKSLKKKDKATSDL
jgi:putative IMPACT (imprinted ancient) family translation regulator